ncbi:TfoX/Sxy family DNA transformation protein [Photobacterium sp. GB-72]|uniref:TfoX/Sxy family DNA transformation protein n=1 Tax=Photobacterium sp. GB-72 TaxID=2022105 RepID=UPI000D168B49|nr:TfoX/Sxy family DNA transformation protein [Photobacterium sp. GB-72]PSV28087.1 hypothetical protein C9J40_19600 [Photobacterium sp. GB-72]
MNIILVKAMKLVIAALNVDKNEIKAVSCVGGFSLRLKDTMIGLVKNETFFVIYHSSNESDLFTDSQRLFNNDNSLLYAVDIEDAKAKDMIVAAYNSSLQLQNANAKTQDVRNLQFIDDELRYYLKELNIQNTNDIKALGAIAIYQAIKNKRGSFSSIEHLYALDNISHDEFSSFITKERRVALSTLALS